MDYLITIYVVNLKKYISDNYLANNKLHELPFLGQDILFKLYVAMQYLIMNQNQNLCTYFIWRWGRTIEIGAEFFIV